MKKGFLLLALLSLLLTACGRQTYKPVERERRPEEPPVADRAEILPDETVPTVAQPTGPEKAAPVQLPKKTKEEPAASLYSGQGYSIRIPEAGWRLEKDRDDGVTEDVWESTLRDGVELQVHRYPLRQDITAAQVRARFAADEDYVFEDLTGGDFGAPLTGVERDGDVMKFMSAMGRDAIYIIAWEYPAKAAEEFADRLAQIAGTFSIAE